MALEENGLNHLAALPHDESGFTHNPAEEFVTPKPLVGVGAPHRQDAKVLAPELVSFILPKRGVSAGEQEAYGDLFDKLTRAMRPADVTQQIEIARIASLMWDCSCLSRYLNSLLLNARDESLKKLLHGRVDDASTIAEGVRRGDPDAITRAQAVMLQFGLNEEDVHAQSYIIHIDTIERLKRMEFAANREFTRLLKDLDYRKKVFEAARLRELHESLTYQQFRKHGCDITMKVPQ